MGLMDKSRVLRENEVPPKRTAGGSLSSLWRELARELRPGEFYELTPHLQLNGRHPRKVIGGHTTTAKRHRLAVTLRGEQIFVFKPQPKTEE